MSSTLTGITEYNSVAQLVELPAFNRKVVGSSPIRITKDFKAHVEELAPLKGEVVGSNPTEVTNKIKIKVMKIVINISSSSSSRSSRLSEVRLYS